jgi:hypothetical protein
MSALPERAGATDAPAPASSRKNVALLIPDGVGARNFLLGSFLRRAAGHGCPCVLHVIPDDVRLRYQPDLNGRVQWRPLLTYRESPRLMTLRYALAYAHMFWGDTHGMRYTRDAPVKGSWRTKAMHRTARLLGRAAASPAGIRLLDRWHCAGIDRLPEVEQYRRLFRDVRPSVLFCSHQRPPIVVPAVRAARSLGIPTATFIFSWDNLTSKGRIAAPFDHFLVWSDQMRRELRRYYPDVSDDRIHIVGTPQFDCYADPSLIWSREEFARRIGADPTRPLICYSGGDTMTCPEDQHHARILMQLVRSGAIQGRPQVILRPAPVDDGARYDEVRRDFPELLYAKPNWVGGEHRNWALVIPLPDDVQFLANLTHHADVNVNPSSTMTLDFAVHDKPIVNVAFSVADPPPHGMPHWEFVNQFDHYRPVIELGAVRFARSPEALAQHVNAYLENPALDREARRRLVALEVGHPIGHSSERILDVLHALARP